MSHDANAPGEAIPGQLLLHHWPLVAALVLVVNDWWLKRHWSGWWSGKLSDFALCFLLPVVLIAGWEWLTKLALWRRWRPAGAVACLLACLGAGSYFSLLQLSEQFSKWHTGWLHALLPSYHFVATPDVTDLIALLVLPLTWRYLDRQQGLTRRRAVHGSVCARETSET